MVGLDLSTARPQAARRPHGLGPAPVPAPGGGWGTAYHRLLSRPPTPTLIPIQPSTPLRPRQIPQQFLKSSEAIRDTRLGLESTLILTKNLNAVHDSAEHCGHDLFGDDDIFTCESIRSRLRLDSLRISARATRVFVEDECPPFTRHTSRATPSPYGHLFVAAQSPCLHFYCLEHPATTVLSDHPNPHWNVSRPVLLVLTVLSLAMVLYDSPPTQKARCVPVSSCLNSSRCSALERLQAVAPAHGHCWQLPAEPVCRSHYSHVGHILIRLCTEQY